MSGRIDHVEYKIEGAECPICGHPVWGAREGESFQWEDHMMTCRHCQNPDCEGYLTESLVIKERTCIRKEYYCSCGKEGSAQYFRGIYAGIWCESCWNRSPWDKRQEEVIVVSEDGYQYWENLE